MTGPRWLVACDLDQTLIYSRAAFRLPPGEGEPALVTVEYLDGEPLSYLTQRAASALQTLAAEAIFVPVTTRTIAQYQRVRLGVQPEYAIAANGGHLLVNGVPDTGWEASVRRRLAETGAALPVIRRLAEELVAAADAGTSWVKTVREADGYFSYLVATERAAIPDLQDFARELARHGWTLSVQGRKVYLVPAALTKEAAIAEVVRRTGSTRWAAAGDSLLDLGMLTAADESVRPAHGELAQQATMLPSLAVTDQVGLLAGEEIIEMLRQIVTREGDSRNANVTFRTRAG